eukprot:TRINITY_DN250_c1_g1_i1.p1 TRINITY_DN250_c1_g1~~TRINITY_DN250_c1_g1_i1.p1  ORF type:complete len:623 (+),score=167.04 TRINITY_DN250_c1_g1_i1:532-2400(+)
MSQAPPRPAGNPQELRSSTPGQPSGKTPGGGSDRKSSVPIARAAVHDFQVTTFKKPTDCGACDKFLWGLRKQGMTCSFCKLPVHIKCKDAVMSSNTPPCDPALSKKLKNRQSVHKNRRASVMVELCTNASHTVALTQFTEPVTCHHCFQFIYGIGLQGYKCENCVFALHKHCVQVHIADNPDTVNLTTTTNAFKKKSNLILPGKENHTHNFAWHTFKSPTNCKYCGKFLWGLRKQGLICKVGACGYTIHDKCVKLFEKEVSSKQEIDVMKSQLEKKEREIEEMKKTQETTSQSLNDLQIESKPSPIASAKGLVDPDHFYEVDPADLVLGKCLGVGGFGEVYKAELHGKDIAVKKLLLNRGDAEKIAREFEKEVTIMKALHHPNIIMLMGASTNPSNLLIVTELAENGSLLDVLAAERTSMMNANPQHPPPVLLSFSDKMRIAQETALGMNWLHKQKPPIIHRDLKPANILLDKVMTAKLADFGISEVFSPLGPMNMVGSPTYMAPELLLGQPYDGKADCYAFAFVLWEMMTYLEPYKNEFHSYEELVQAIAYDDYRPFMPDFVPPRLRALIERLWHHDPQLRPSFDEILKSKVLQMCAQEVEQTNYQTSPFARAPNCTGGVY